MFKRMSDQHTNCVGRADCDNILARVVQSIEIARDSRKRRLTNWIATFADSGEDLRRAHHSKRPVLSHLGWTGAHWRAIALTESASEPPGNGMLRLNQPVQRAEESNRLGNVTDLGFGRARRGPASGSRALLSPPTRGSRELLSSSTYECPGAGADSREILSSPAAGSRALRRRSAAAKARSRLLAGRSECAPVRDLRGTSVARLGRERSRPSVAHAARTVTTHPLHARLQSDHRGATIRRRSAHPGKVAPVEKERLHGIVRSV